MIIGLTGPNAGGKGETAKVIESLGYKYYSLSDEIRLVCKERNLEPTRDNMISIGNEFRVKHGPGVWAKTLVERIKNKSERIIIDSIRHPKEVEELKKLKKFALISIDAPIKVRFERALKRQRVGDPKTLEEFREKEEKEMSKDINSQQIGETMKLADYKIINNTTLQDLDNKIKQLVKNL